MSILVVSVSHRSTSVGMLSRLAMDAVATAKLAEQLVSSDHIDEAVVLSTCNRTELYTSVSRFHGGLDDAVAALADLAGLTVEEVRTLCAVFFDEAAVAHTFSVTAGLDSVVLGESQILGQVRAALSLCQAQGTVGTVLNALFQQALRVGKRVQAETGIGSAGRSLVTAAYELLTAERGELTLAVAGDEWSMPRCDADVRMVLDGPTVELFTSSGALAAPVPARNSAVTIAVRDSDVEVFELG